MIKIGLNGLQYAVHLPDSLKWYLSIERDCGVYTWTLFDEVFHFIDSSRAMKRGWNGAFWEPHWALRDAERYLSAMTSMDVEL